VGLTAALSLSVDKVAMCFSFQMLIKHRRFCDFAGAWTTSNPPDWRVIGANVVLHDIQSRNLNLPIQAAIPSK
jgi:hypothetical protein